MGGGNSKHKKKDHKADYKSQQSKTTDVQPKKSPNKKSKANKDDDLTHGEILITKLQGNEDYGLNITDNSDSNVICLIF